MEANFGATPFTYPPPSGYTAGFGPRDGLVLIAGTPIVLEGPNRVAQATGALAVLCGTPSLQLGYPETITGQGTAVVGHGAPTLLPYSARTVFPVGRSSLRSGLALVQRDPISPASNVVVHHFGTSALRVGVPSTAGSSAILLSGIALLKVGHPSAGQGVRVAGTKTINFGTPSLSATLRVVGTSACRVGTPSFGSRVAVSGALALHTGAPALLGGAMMISPSGIGAFACGTPSIAAVRATAFGHKPFRAGTPRVSRASIC